MVSRAFGSNFDGCDEISELICRCTFPILWKRITTVYSNGGSAVFGGVEVSRAGISVNVWTSLGFGELGGKTKPIAWGDITSFDVQNGRFRVFGEGRELANLSTATVPNIHVLLALLQAVQPQNSLFAKL
jgi:hypothetical protein